VAALTGLSDRARGGLDWMERGKEGREFGRARIGLEVGWAKER
jgi:hypothetical protein